MKCQRQHADRSFTGISLLPRTGIVRLNDEINYQIQELLYELAL
jgi:hypothetical protein